jgi:hypothetical protein
MITDARVIELAKKFEAYPLALEPTIRGVASILAFARALVAESSLAVVPAIELADSEGGEPA